MILGELMWVWVANSLPVGNQRSSPHVADGATLERGCPLQLAFSDRRSSGGRANSSRGFSMEFWGKLRGWGSFRGRGVC